MKLRSRNGEKAYAGLKALLGIAFACIGVVACQTEEELTFETQQSFINGRAAYIDIITGDTVFNEQSIVNTVVQIGDGQNLTQSGGLFKFGPLQTLANYNLVSEYFDTTQNVRYVAQYQYDTLQNGVSELFLLLKPTSFQVLLTGNVAYIDAITGEFVTEQADIRTTIVRSDSLGNSLLGETRTIGNTFRFDSLEAGRQYRLTSIYDDEEKHILYELDTVITVAENSISMNMPLTLKVSSIFTTQIGKVFYQDPIDGQRKIADGATGLIRFKDPLKNFADNVAYTSEGSDISFGPLIASDYIREFHFNDGIFEYEYIDTINITGQNHLIYEEVVAFPKKQALMSGKVYYTDPITGNRLLANTAVGEIMYVDENKAFSPQVVKNSQGESYRFGTLLPGIYRLSFLYNDGVFDHQYDQTIEVDGNERLLNRDIELTLVKSTGLVVRVTDVLGNPIEGAEVYLYNNLEFLRAYLDDPEAALAYGQTGANGSAVFANLTPGNTYAYVTKRFGSDVLNNESSSANPVSLANQVIRIMNTFVE